VTFRGTAVHPRRRAMCTTFWTGPASTTLELYVSKDTKASCYFAATNVDGFLGSPLQGWEFGVWKCGVGILKVEDRACLRAGLGGVFKMVRTVVGRDGFCKGARVW
jgi:hypothetical protein